MIINENPFLLIINNEPPCHQNVTNNQLQSFTYRSHTDSNICYMKPKISFYKYRITRLMISHDVQS